jgi:hypothetical protein
MTQAATLAQLASSGALSADSSGSLIIGGPQLFMLTANSGIEIGSNTVNTPYIDFHSSANSVDFDSRIIASGGTSTAGNGTLSIVSSFFQFNSGYGSSATAYGCRAWVNFNGTGTVAIRGSGNVSSITDNGVGDYTVNFTTAMPDVNYSVVMASSVDGNYNQTGVNQTALTAAGAKVRTMTAGGAYADSNGANVAILR